MTPKKSSRKNLYLAGPLFSEIERQFNSDLRKMLRPYLDTYLPQEDGGLLVAMVQDGLPLDVAVSKVFAGDMAAIKNADFLLINLDGRTVDEGASFELGVAYA